MTNSYINPAGSNNPISEAYRYLANAKETIAKSPIEYGIYTDPKYVCEAAGIAYLSALKAINGYLISRGIKENEIPTSINEYRYLIQKKMPHNGKFMAALHLVYQNLHIFAYYREKTSVNILKEGFANCKKIIDMLATSMGVNTSALIAEEPKTKYHLKRKAQLMTTNDNQ